MRDELTHREELRAELVLTRSVFAEKVDDHDLIVRAYRFALENPDCGDDLVSLFETEERLRNEAFALSDRVRELESECAK